MTTTDPDSDYSSFRAREALRRTISANWGQWYDENAGRYFMPLFMTFTFQENMQDIIEANSRFHDFIRRLNHELLYTRKAVLKYSWVIEVQERGAFHYHIVVYNLPFIEKLIERLYAIWNEVEKNGSVNFRSKMKDVRNVGAYVTKYMSKDFTRSDLPKGFHLYNNANHLRKPEVLKYIFNDDGAFSDMSSEVRSERERVWAYIEKVERERPLFERATDLVVYQQYFLPSGFSFD